MRKKRAARPRRAAKSKTRKPRARKKKVIVRVVWEKKKRKYAPPPRAGTKRVLAYIIFAVALAVGVTAFYDLAYYGYVVLPAGPSYILALADGSGGTSSSDSFNLAVSLGEAIVGKAESDGFALTLGAMGFLAGDVTPPSCTIEQSTGTPAQGEDVILTAICTDDIGLAQITFYTDESGIMEEIIDYGSPADVSGTEANVSFLWNNPEIEEGTTISWKVKAIDTSGNEGESVALAFTVGAPADIIEPTIEMPAATPARPTEGAEVAITVELSDDTELASADLLVNEEVVDSIIVSGKRATAEFKWTAGKMGTYTVKVAATDAAGNIAESSPIFLNVVSAVCDPALKPDDIVGECVNGMRTITTFVCDPSTGTWEPLELTETCAPAPPIAFLAIGVVALAVALAAALYILKRRPKGPAAPAPPATFG